MEEILENYEQQIRMMYWKHRWVGLVYNWIVVICVVSLFASFFWWGMDIHTRKQAEAMTAEYVAQINAEQEQKIAEAEAEQAAFLASQEHIRTEEAKTVAKAFYGIRNFVDKYGYTQKDLETYARCIFNRADATGQSISDVVSKKDQFLGYSDNNQLVKEYYDLAIRLVDEWHDEEVKPCDASYQWAELTEHGVYLRNSFKADGYARRWQA